MISKLPEQRTTMAVKREPKWYVPTIDYYISKAISTNDKTDTARNLNAANGLIDDESIRYVLKPFGDKTDVYLKGNKLPGELRDVDLITSVKDKQIGEYLELPFRYTVITHNANTVMKHHADIKKQMEKLMQQAYINEVNKIQETGVPSQEVPDLSSFAEKYTKSWLEDKAIEAFKRVELNNQENNFEVLRIKNFFYWWACEEFYTYRYIDGDCVREESISPLQAYPIDNGEEFVEDMEGMLVRTPINFNTFISKYGSKFTGAQKDIVKNLTEKYYSGLPLEITYQMYYKDFRDWEEMKTQPSESRIGTAATNIVFNNDQIIEDRITFTTQKLVRNLIYRDVTGTIKEMPVDEDYVFNPENGDVEIEEDYVNTLVTAYRFGGDTGLYIEPEEELVVRRDKNNPSKIKLPYGGKNRIFNGLYRNPIPKRMIPYQALIRIYTLAQERTIAKYRSDFITIPKSVLESGEEADIVGRMFYLKADGTLVYDDSVTNLQDVVQGIRVLPGSGAEKYIMAMQQLIQSVKQSSWEISNMNDERFGNTKSSATATGTQANLYQAKVGSNLKIFMFNKALERDLNADVEYTKYAWINGKKGTFINPITNKPEELEVDGLEHLNTEYGIFMTDAVDEYNKLEDFKKLAFNASQNGDNRLASEAIIATSSIELSKFIEEHDKIEKEFQQSMEQSKNQAIENAAKQNELTAAKDRASNEKIAQMKEEGENYRKQLEINNELASELNSNMYEHSSSMSDANRKEVIEQKKLNLKQQDLDQRNRFHEDEMRIKKTTKDNK